MKNAEIEVKMDKFRNELGKLFGDLQTAKEENDQTKRN